MTIASPAAHVQQNAPLKLFQRATASTLSTLMLASNAVLVQTLALLKLPRLNNLHQKNKTASFPEAVFSFTLTCRTGKYII
jgi:hypothetical protein